MLRNEMTPLPDPEATLHCDVIICVSNTPSRVKNTVTFRSFVSGVIRMTVPDTVVPSIANAKSNDVLLLLAKHKDNAGNVRPRRAPIPDTD